MRLIDADKLLRDIEHFRPSDGKFQHWVEVQPTAEPVKGEWIYHDCGNSGVYLGVAYATCSECGGYALTKIETMYDFIESNFCPHCGADMRGENN